jgi:GR25 family glycosyltransferase involved in LPS biosynthesis
MNGSNLVLLSNATNLSLFSLINYYALIIFIPAISLIGFILNTICLLVLFSSKLDGDSYKFQIAKTAIHTLAILLNVLSIITNCRTCSTFNLYGSRIFSLYFLAFLSSSLVAMSWLIEIVVTYDRLSMLRTQSKCCQIRASFDRSFLFVIAIGLGINLFVPFAFEIKEKAAQSNRYIVTRTRFGESLFYINYTIAINIIQSLLSFVMIVALNWLMTIRFKRYLNKKATIVTNGFDTVARLSSTNNQETKSTINKEEILQRIKKPRKSTLSEKAEKNFTLMVIVSSTIFMFSRFFNLVSNILSERNRLLNIEGDLISGIMRLVNMIFMSTYFSLNLVLNYKFNKAFKYCLNSTLKAKVFFLNKC